MTIILRGEDPSAPVQAAQAIHDGKLILLPTDTVYGIASAIQDDAIYRLFMAKQRPPDKAVPILLSDAEYIDQVVLVKSPHAMKLIEAFMPGPLTLVLPKRQELPANVSQLPTIGIRIPANDTARTIIRAAGGALAVSSANLSGQSAAQTVKEALTYFPSEIAVAIDDGPSAGQNASTVAQLDGRTIKLVRQGPISLAELEAVLEDQPLSG